MAASASNESVCEDFHYEPSQVESAFREHANEYTGGDLDTLCSKMGDWQLWLRANAEPRLPVPAIFSRLCKPGMRPQLLEPLAGILRSPRAYCKTSYRGTYNGLSDEDWFVTGDDSLSQPGGTARLYDAGATRFKDVLLRMLGHYERRGVVFDEVYAWEYKKHGVEFYWNGTPAEIRRKWEGRLTFYDGVGVTADANSVHNPVSLIHRNCKPEDFCVFKLDIDTPRLEVALVKQLLAAPFKTAASLDEFFFEHHVANKWMERFWGHNLKETVHDSYEYFSRLRELGVRAHSWN